MGGLVILLLVLRLTITCMPQTEALKQMARAQNLPSTGADYLYKVADRDMYTTRIHSKLIRCCTTLRPHTKASWNWQRATPCSCSDTLQIKAG